jgi:hypothetical protein
MHVCLILASGHGACADGPLSGAGGIEHQLVQPALAAFDNRFGSITRLSPTLPLPADALAALVSADLLICDISQGDGPVWYALGLRHALRRRHTLLIRGTRPSAPRAAPALPPDGFDRSQVPVLDYDAEDPAAGVPALQAGIESALRQQGDSDSPVYLLAPALREARSAQLSLAPLGMLQAAARAEARGDRGALRLLAEQPAERGECADLLKALARAQARLDDPGGACRSWQRLVELGGADVETELGLARQHLEQHARRGGPHDLALAQQALERLPSRPAFALRSPEQAVEAAMLAARAQLHQWRLAWQGLPNPRERRRRAACPILLSLPSAFLQAQRLDLHDLAATMAALHALRTLALLSTDDDTATRLYARPVDARDALSVLERDTESLRMLASLALQRLDQLQGAGDTAVASLARAEMRWLDATEATHPELAASRVREALMAATPPAGDLAANAMARALRERLEDAAALGLDTIAAPLLVGLGGWGAAPSLLSGRRVVLALDDAAGTRVGAEANGAAPLAGDALAHRLRALGGAPGTTRLVAAARTAWEHQVRDIADSLGWSTDVLGAWDEPPPAPVPCAWRWMLHAAAALAPASLILLLPAGDADANAGMRIDEARTLLGPAVQVELLK